MRLRKAGALAAAVALALAACEKVTVADNGGNEATADANEVQARGNAAHPSDPIESAMAAARPHRFAECDRSSRRRQTAR